MFPHVSASLLFLWVFPTMSDSLLPCPDCVHLYLVYIVRVFLCLVPLCLVCIAESQHLQSHVMVNLCLGSLFCLKFLVDSLCLLNYFLFGVIFADDFLFMFFLFKENFVCTFASWCVLVVFPRKKFFFLFSELWFSSRAFGLSLCPALTVMRPSSDFEGTNERKSLLGFTSRRRQSKISSEQSYQVALLIAKAAQWAPSSPFAC